MNTRSKRSPGAAGRLGLLVLLPGVVLGSGPAEFTWSCSSGSFEREIVLLRNEGPIQDPAGNPDAEFACRVEYSRDGESEVLWLARNNPDYCRPKVLALVGKLQAGGFHCQESGTLAEGADRSVTGTTDENRKSPPAHAIQVPTNRSGDDTALRALLERHYEDFYLDAMIAVIPPGFTVAATSDAVETESGEVLFVGPPNHFVKTLADGSYVLVNTLVLRHESTSSFVNLGFVVRDNRYSFLGYAMVHAAVEAKVTDADANEVRLMATTAATASCEGVRRIRALPWVPDFASASSQQLRDAQVGSRSTSDCIE